MLKLGLQKNAAYQRRHKSRLALLCFEGHILYKF